MVTNPLISKVAEVLKCLQYATVDTDVDQKNEQFVPNSSGDAKVVLKVFGLTDFSNGWVGGRCPLNKFINNFKLLSNNDYFRSV